MIKMYTASTREIDDAQTAVSEILGQLDLERALLRDSVGIIEFYSEFIETGVAKAICDAMPFDVIGCTTSDVAVPSDMGSLALSLAVLTSDDVTFAAGLSAPITDDLDGPIGELYSRIAGDALKPSFLYVIAPVLQNVSGDEFIKAIDKYSGGAPLFGSLAFTHMPDFSGVRTFFNGEPHNDALALIAMSGEVYPEFFMSSIPDDMVINQKAVLTDAEKNALRRVNDMPILEYLKSIGLSDGSNIAGISSVPIVLTLEDGSRVVRSAYMVNEEGFVLCYGDVPRGAAISFANVNADYVIRSAEETTARVFGKPNSAVLMYSCAGRKWTLGMRSDAEMDAMAKRALCAKKPARYQFAYSGGEICPAPREDGTYVNRFHNFTFIACVI
ncbi:MAG: FIST C-terminal domain-containing protein [Synergistaceae bacterium]|jgi:hypothetical protein|nr:FIST C-terminal domain-containing protein [Synergistaceae bacterium]